MLQNAVNAGVKKSALFVSVDRLLGRIAADLGRSSKMHKRLALVFEDAEVRKEFKTQLKERAEADLAAKEEMMAALRSEIVELEAKLEGLIY